MKWACVHACMRPIRGAPWGRKAFPARGAGAGKGIEKADSRGMNAKARAAGARRRPRPRSS